MPEQLTPRQRKIMDALAALTKEKGFPPSLRELGQAVGLASISSVSHQLHELERKGYVRRDPSVPRGLIVVGAVSEGAQALLDAADEIAEIDRIGQTRGCDLTDAEKALFAESPLSDLYPRFGNRGIVEQWLRDRAAAIA